MKRIILLFLILSSSYFTLSAQTNDTCCGFYNNKQSGLGIGIVIAPDSFQLYNDSLLKRPFGCFSIRSNRRLDSVCPRFYKPDYGIMHYVCLSKTKKAYKVLVNRNDIKYIPNKKEYEFKLWPAYILQSLGICELPRNARNPLCSPLKSGPDEKADTLPVVIKEDSQFCPLLVEGNWVKVKLDCHSENPDGCKNNNISLCEDITGWIKWREGDSLLIGIFLIE